MELIRDFAFVCDLNPRIICVSFFRNVIDPMVHAVFASNTIFHLNGEVNLDLKHYLCCLLLGVLVAELPGTHLNNLIFIKHNQYATNAIPNLATLAYDNEPDKHYFEEDSSS